MTSSSKPISSRDDELTTGEVIWRSLYQIANISDCKAVLQFLNTILIGGHKLYGEVFYYNSPFAKKKDFSLNPYEHPAVNQRVNVQHEQPSSSLRHNRSYAQMVTSNKPEKR